MKLFQAKGRIATDILGRSKYTTYTEALNEAVSNSLDWYAENVWITINKNSIEIKDDGCGMSDRTLVERYFTLGEMNKDPKKRGQFGIGICANAAVGNIVEITSHEKGAEFATTAKINFNKLEKVNLGEYTPEQWDDKVKIDSNHHGSSVIIKDLRWSDINKNDIAEYLIQKHWIALLDKDISLKIWVNGEILKAQEPEYEEKYEFDSKKKFEIDSKCVPMQPDLKCGRVSGVFYLSDGITEPSIDVYVKMQRLDAYSGDSVDWLRIKDLSSPKGFQSSIKGIIKVDAVESTPEDEKDPMVIMKNSGKLILKSDRSRFFENTNAFKDLVAYLNEKSKGSQLKLPNGGILRLINNKWYKNRASDNKKNIAAIEKNIEKIKPEIEKVLKKADIFRRVSNVGEEKEKPKKRDDKNENNSVKADNKMFICSSCGKINRVSVEYCKKWEKLNEGVFWKCEACGSEINFLSDRYKKASPQAQSGKTIAKIDLGTGKIKEIKADLLGSRGPRATYFPEDEVVKINAEHALLAYALRASEEAFNVNMLDSIILAISIEIAEDTKEKFQIVYNEMVSNIRKIIEEKDGEEAIRRILH